jgi:hypothetical protein
LVALRGFADRSTRGEPGRQEEREGERGPTHTYTHIYPHARAHAHTHRSAARKGLHCFGRYGIGWEEESLETSAQSREKGSGGR